VPLTIRAAVKENKQQQLQLQKPIQGSFHFPFTAFRVSVRMTALKGGGYSLSVVVVSWGISEPLLRVRRPVCA
jgi:hypothetical protein